MIVIPTSGKTYIAWTQAMIQANPGHDLVDSQLEELYRSQSLAEKASR